MSSRKRKQVPKTYRVVNNLPDNLPILEGEAELIGNFMRDVLLEILNSDQTGNQKRDYLLRKD